MDLQELRWIKNVNNPEGGWVYKHDEVTYPYLVPEFSLHWKISAKENAHKPNPDDLILLCQRMRVTHLVKILDNFVRDNSPYQEYPFYRRVQVMWMAAKSWEEAPQQEEVFGFDFQFRHGKAINLDNVNALQEYFGEGGLAAFQERVKEKLGLLN
ncbi:MAG: hypothetical protein WBG73_21690 [Coleofasciculaceae cyanobacterium]